MRIKNLASLGPLMTGALARAAASLTTSGSLGDRRRAQVAPAQDRHAPMCEPVVRVPSTATKRERVVEHGTVAQNGCPRTLDDQAVAIHKGWERADLELVELIRDSDRGLGRVWPGLFNELLQIVRGSANGIVIRQLKGVTNMMHELARFDSARSTLFALDVDLDTTTTPGRTGAALSMIVDSWERDNPRRTRAAGPTEPGVADPDFAAKTRSTSLVEGRGWLLGGVRVSVVIPTRNEAKNLPYVFDRLPSGLHEVIVVDGHSTDDTVEYARRLRPDARIITQTGRGKGNALRTAFYAATGDIIVMVDADGSTDPAEIPRFVAALQNGADFVKGSRFAQGGGSLDITRTRRVGNRALNILVNGLYGTSYTDLCYGYNAFWRRCLSYMRIDCDGFEVETLINIRVAKAGLVIHEVPSFESRRLHGASNLRAVRDGVRVLRTIAFERYPRLKRGAGAVARFYTVRGT